MRPSSIDRGAPKKNLAPTPFTKARMRAQKALQAARGGLRHDVAISAAHTGVKENPLHSLERLRHARRIAELTGRGTSVARIKRHGNRADEEELLEELELEEREERAKREEIAKLGLAPPLPRTVLRPKPRKKKE
jgi:hypothetical protein